MEEIQFLRMGSKTMSFFTKFWFLEKVLVLRKVKSREKRRRKGR
jgi:hypothetical protein